MRPLVTLIRREFAAYFLSPVAYVAMFFFLFFLGVLFLGVLTGLTETGPDGLEYPVRALFGADLFWFVFLFIPPLLTMRLLAEERGSGTLEMLLTAPIRDWQVVAGKYLGAVLFYVVLWLPTLVYVPVLVGWDWHAWAAAIDPTPVVTAYAGAFFAGAMFLAVGLFVSSLVKNQLVAAILSLLLLLGFVAAGFVDLGLDPGSLAARLVAFVSVPDHFRRDFTRGVVDTRALVLYLSVTALCLFLTVRSLEARRLRA